MASIGTFNIFYKQSTEPNHQQASNMFSFVVNQPNNNQRPLAPSTTFKRQIFRNQIRKHQNQEKRKVMRQDLLKTLQSIDLLNLLEEFVSKDKLDSKNIQNMINDLSRNIQDLDFCRRLNQQTEIKNFVLKIYLENQKNLTIQQKGLLVSCLIYLTFFNMKAFTPEQKHELNEVMIMEISQIKEFDWPQIDYLRRNIELLTNITSDNDFDINHYLLDTSLFSEIGNKITEIANQGQKMAENNSHDQELQKKYAQGLNDIRNAFVLTLRNLSEPNFANLSFFQFTVGQLVNDRNYLIENGPETLRIFRNFFKKEEFRDRFLGNQQLVQWLETQVSGFCQKKFLKGKNMTLQQFQEIKLSKEERDTIFWYLKCLLTLFEEQQGKQLEYQVRVSVEICLNLFCLSEFMIQCSTNDFRSENLIRNSLYVSKAIEVYDMLASSKIISYPQLLTVGLNRTQYDIFKILLEETYFTSHKISENTISLLNKFLSQDPKLIKTLIELDIFDSIHNFLLRIDTVQTPEQILNFFDLLILLLDSDHLNCENEKQEPRRRNYVAEKIEREGFLLIIEKYQENKNNEVCQKAESFIEYFTTCLNVNEKHLY